MRRMGVYSIGLIVSSFARNSAGQDVAMRNYFSYPIKLLLFLGIFGSGVQAEVLIDSQWLSDNSPSPYYLSDPGETYILNVDVSVPGTGFVIHEDGITLDLNGHTITYDTRVAPVVPNGHFENGNAQWTTTSGSPQVAAGTIVNPVSVWSGSQSLQFSVPSGNQSVRSNQQITLPANSIYYLTAMFYNVLDYSETPTMYVELQGPQTIRVEHVGRSQRGFTYLGTQIQTGSTDETYFIEAGLTSASGFTEAGIVYIDDILIRNQYHYGVLIGPVEWRSSELTDVDENHYGRADNVTVRNGTIIQGAGNGDRSHAIRKISGNDTNINNLMIRVHGPNGANISMNSPINPIIDNNVLENNVEVITRRDHFDGVVIDASRGHGGEIKNNIILGGSQNGIVAASDDLNNTRKIFNNSITLGGRIRHTNGFAIQLYGDQGSHVYNNTINCGDGQNQCRGIFTGGQQSNGTKIFNNNVSVQQLANNQEYDGCSFGAYGIQIETANDVEVYGNTVSAHARECTAAAFRMNALDTARNIHVYNNDFIAIRHAPDIYSATMKIADIPFATEMLHFEKNTLVTNSRWVQGRNTENLEIRETVFQALTNSFEDTFDAPLVAQYWQHNRTDLGHEQLAFIDSRFFDTSSENYLKDTPIQRMYYIDYGDDPYSSFIVQWTLNIETVNGGVALPNCNISVLDSQNTLVFSGLTDSNGRISTTVEELNWNSNVKTNSTPHNISASCNGSSRQVQKTITNTTTVVLNFGSNTRPRVEAGPDQAVTLAAGGSLLDAFVIDDDLPANPGLVTTIWREVPDSGRVTFADRNEVNTTVSFTEVGTYVLELYADDSELTETDQLTIIVSETVNNQPPSVNVGTDQTIEPNEFVSLSGIVTDDNNPSPPTLTFMWSRLSGPGAVEFVDEESVTTTATFEEVGTYVLRLTAYDGQLSGYDDLTVFVGSGHSGEPPSGTDPNPIPDPSNQDDPEKFTNVASANNGYRIDITCESTVRIYNQRGDLVASLSCSGDVAVWDASDVPSGIYFVHRVGLEPRKVVVIR